MSGRTDLQRELLMPLPSNRVEFWHQPEECCFYVVETDAQFITVRAAGPFPDSMTLGEALEALRGPLLSASEIVELERRATVFEIQEYRGGLG